MSGRDGIGSPRQPRMGHYGRRGHRGSTLRAHSAARSKRGRSLSRAEVRQRGGCGGAVRTENMPRSIYEDGRTSRIPDCVGEDRWVDWRPAEIATDDGFVEAHGTRL